jgi:hypothetical protein
MSFQPVAETFLIHALNRIPLTILLRIEEDFSDLFDGVYQNLSMGWYLALTLIRILPGDGIALRSPG